MIFDTSTCEDCNNISICIRHKSIKQIENLIGKSYVHEYGRETPLSQYLSQDNENMKVTLPIKFTCEHKSYKYYNCQRR